MPGVSNRKKDHLAILANAPSRPVAGSGIGRWGAVNRWGSLPDFILPSPRWCFIACFCSRAGWQPAPQQPGKHFLRSLRSGGCSLMATLMGYALAKSKTAEQGFRPFLVASQAVPWLPFHLLRVIWLDPAFSKILIVRWWWFFPILVNTVVRCTLGAG